jgi:hypothetical protein
MDTDRLKKLLAYALDPAASDGELENAGLKALREARRLGLNLNGLAVALAPQAGRIVYRDVVQVTVEYRDRIVYRVPPGDMVLPFGKYRGRTLAEVFAENPGYVRWFAENATTADPLLIDAAWQLVDEDED